MANEVISSASFITPSRVLPTTTDTGVSAANVADWAHPFRVWRATGFGSGNNLVIDFGVTTSVAAVHIDNLNCSLITIQGNATNSWGSPSFSNADVTVARDGRDGRYRLGYRALTSFNYRYMNIFTSQSSGIDGGVGLQVGTVACFSAVTQWTDSQPEFPLSWTAIDPCEEGEGFAGGGAEPVSLGNTYIEQSLTNANLEPAGISTMETVIGYGRSQLFLFYLNDGDTSHGYLVRRKGLVTMSRDSPGWWSYANILLREAV